MHIRFFKGESEFPKFKSRKKSKPGFYVDTDKIRFTNNKHQFTSFLKNTIKQQLSAYIFLSCHLA